MRYIRMYKGSEDGSPGVTLYEVDADGWVHRQLQVHAEGVRFSPEDILLRRPVSVTFMITHPDAEEIAAEEFELHWAEFDHRRSFRSRLPNAWQSWRGRMLDETPEQTRELHWSPSGTHPGEGWQRVPGFLRLFVLGDRASAWATQRDLFLERPIEWTASTGEAVRVDLRVQHVDGPGLARAICSDRLGGETLGHAMA
jgi:hypothetical protein